MEVVVQLLVEGRRGQGTGQRGGGDRVAHLPLATGRVTRMAGRRMSLMARSRHVTIVMER